MDEDFLGHGAVISNDSLVAGTSAKAESEPAFRAIDLMHSTVTFGNLSHPSMPTHVDFQARLQESQVAELHPSRATSGELQPDLFGHDSPPAKSDHGGCIDLESESEPRESSLNHVDDDAGFDFESEPVSGPVVSSGVWQSMVNDSFSSFRATHAGLLYPWETGTLACIFSDDNVVPALECPPLIHSAAEEPSASVGGSQGLTSSNQLDVDCKFTLAVKNLPDLDYFQQKSQSLELACGRWMELLSLSWDASSVGVQLALDLQTDAHGNLALESLRACFGTKSPSTLLKRAGTFRQFVKWFKTTEHYDDGCGCAFPLMEKVVWDYFLWLRRERAMSSKGYTSPSTFLETVRFAKFTVGLKGADEILQSRRLLGFAAIEKGLKGPTRQAPGLELSHLQRLHSVLKSGDSLVDRLGAAVFLICIYGRARWSDLRFVESLNFDRHRNGSLTIYTKEHKTSNVGTRREQFLPIIVPWEGVTNDWWLDTYVDVCEQLGFDLKRKPFGPLMPAPKLGGGFCARPLTTNEAAVWLRSLLAGTPQSESFRSHSLKATLLGWAARAGLDKETRAVLGHHCTALAGSEVVYSRDLQIRSIRKLSMMLRRVRVGLDLEEDTMKQFGLAGTPAMMTPAFCPTTPVPPRPTLPQETAQESTEECPVGDTNHGAVEGALETMRGLEDLQSLKEECVDFDDVEMNADQLSLFPQSLAVTGAIAIESSSGSSSSSSEYSSSDESISDARLKGDVHFTERVPEGFLFFKHRKSGIVHSRKDGQEAFSCKTKLTENFCPLPAVFHVRLPKCLKCFPKDTERIRNLSQLTKAVDAAVKKAKSS